MDAIGIARGSTVADVGADAGYFHLAPGRAGGPGGQRDRHRHSAGDGWNGCVGTRLPAGCKTSKRCWARGAIPVFPRASLDLVLPVDVYHEFSEPQRMLRGIRVALKPGGRLVLLEYRKEDPAVPIRAEHKMSVAEVRAEVEPEGFRSDKVLETLPRQHILIFRP